MFVACCAGDEWMEGCAEVVEDGGEVRVDFGFSSILVIFGGLR